MSTLWRYNLPSGQPLLDDMDHIRVMPIGKLNGVS